MSFREKVFFSYMWVKSFDHAIVPRTKFYEKTSKLSMRRSREV